MLRISLVLIMLGTSLHALANSTAWINQVQFISYTPSEFYFENGQAATLSATGIREDLRVLRRYGSGLILYATDKNTSHIVESANQLQYKALILGVWSPHNKHEVTQAINLAQQHPSLVKAIVLGNEGLFFKRYSSRELKQVFSDIRARLPKIALATTEPFASYLADPALLDCSDQDFLLPTIHPIFERWYRPDATAQSVDFVVHVSDKLRALCDKDVLIKETGMPSGPASAGFSEKRQHEFWKMLFARLKNRKGITVAMFEAYDAPWKIEEIKNQTGKYDEREAYWGWFHANRDAKTVAGLLKSTTSK